MPVSLGDAYHGAWNIRQGGAGLDTDVSIYVDAGNPWRWFPKLLLPQYDAVLNGNHMYILHAFRQSGVDNNQGWVMIWILGVPLRNSNGTKFVQWFQLVYTRAGFSTNRRFAAIPASTAAAKGTAGALYFDTSPQIQDGTDYAIGLDCWFDNDGNYKWKANLSRV
jgi:hypothetical protein